MLQQRGAALIDADDLARRAVEPGTHGYAEVLRRFGPEVVALSGELDRERLATVVFADPDRRRELESITHPEVARLFFEEVEPHRGTDRVGVFVVPLLVEAGMVDWFDAIVVVTASPATRVARAARDRGMSEQAVRDRIAAQIDDRERERAATFVIPNEGALDQLESEVDRVWGDLVTRAHRG
jgi:dephospho-CoA kinase